jgi:predicted nucleic acid-binding protein
MDACLLDTDILSEILKGRNAVVLQNSADYLAQHSKLCFSVFSWYEVVRGMRSTNATTRLREFEAFRRNCDLLDITPTVLNRAADLWVHGRSHGCKLTDGDIIIAATAIESGRVLVTGNTSDFSWMPGVRLANWRMPP